MAKIPKEPSSPVKIKSTNQDYPFREGEEAEVIGVRWIKGRVCFMLLYEDGFVDYIPICDESNYELT